MCLQLDLMASNTAVPIAAKTLTRVEVDPGASRQHEFHAGHLRRLLGFPPARTQGRLLLMIHTDDQQEPALDDEGTFTLYDAREADPNRTEWHLYYTTSLLGQLARPGDLLVVLRHDPAGNDLHAIIARPGTHYEARLRESMRLGETPELPAFTRVSPAAPDGASATALALADAGGRSAAGDSVASHVLLRRASETGVMPRPQELASAAHEVVLGMSDAVRDADDFLQRALEVESALFFAVEKALGQRELDRLIAAGGGFTEVLAFAMRKQQSRKARRGLSLQNHIGKLLSLRGIPHRPQCPTEGKEKPDFVIPGHSEYQDPGFPANRLRMIGCKSKVRERWRQYLTEAERIPVKYHVAVDSDLTDDVLTTMHAHNLRLFMPRELVATHYAGREAASLIGSITSLVEDLEAAVRPDTSDR